MKKITARMLPGKKKVQYNITMSLPPEGNLRYHMRNKHGCEVSGRRRGACPTRGRGGTMAMAGGVGRRAGRPSCYRNFKCSDCGSGFVREDSYRLVDHKWFFLYWCVIVTVFVEYKVVCPVWKIYIISPAASPPHCQVPYEATRETQDGSGNIWQDGIGCVQCRCAGTAKIPPRQQYTRIKYTIILSQFRIQYNSLSP